MARNSGWRGLRPVLSSPVIMSASLPDPPALESTLISEKQRIIHPNSLANLNRFVPGQSGNPGGVKKGTVYVSERYKYLQSLPLEELATFTPKCAADEIALNMVEKARENVKTELFHQVVAVVKEITDRTEGKARQSVDVTASVTNINVQVNLFLDAAADLAARHNVPLELAQARMLAIAEPATKQAIEAALAAADRGYVRGPSSALPGPRDNRPLPCNWLQEPLVRLDGRILPHRLRPRLPSCTLRAALHLVTACAHQVRPSRPRSTTRTAGAALDRHPGGGGAHSGSRARGGVPCE